MVSRKDIKSNFKMNDCLNEIGFYVYYISYTFNPWQIKILQVIPEVCFDINFSYYLKD